jgi:hypothetical protein
MSTFEDLSAALGLQSPTSAALANRLRSHQQLIGAATTGRPNPLTLAALEVYDPIEEAPRSFRREMKGEEPGTFSRDLTTTFNQIPRWMYAILAAGAFGMSYWIYRTSRRS